MKKSDIITIILQDAEITRLKKRNEELLRGYLSICKVNDQLRKEIKKLKKDQRPELGKVNT